MKILKMPAAGDVAIDIDQEPASPFSIPTSIAVAIARVALGINHAVEKDQINKHGGYKFASTDAIYAALTKIMGAEGLVCIPLQVEDPSKTEINGKIYVKFVFQFLLATQEASWTHDWNRRTVWIQMTGPQTFQAGQSYAEKSYLKALFKLATGDLDLEVSANHQIDQSEFGELPRAQQVQKKPGYDKEGRPTSHAAKKDPQLVADFNLIKSAIPAETDVEALDEAKQNQVTVNDAGSPLEWGRFPIKWANDLEEEYKQRRFDLLQEAEKSMHGIEEAPQGLI